MDTQQSIQTPPIVPSSPNETPKEKRGILFEIIFVFVFLVLLFGILNYFNILPISEIWPNQLGFLPHRESLKQNPTTIIPPITPTTSLTDTAKKTLNNYLPTILTPSFLPKSSSKITLTQTKGIQESFSTSWNAINGTESAILIVSPDGKNIMQFYLSFIKSKSASPSAELAKITTSQFFSIQPKGIWGCKPIYTSMTYCENFWEESNGVKRGIGIEGLFTKGPNLKKEDLPQTMIFFCEHSQASSLYSWKSCASEFAESGVQ